MQKLEDHPTVVSIRSSSSTTKTRYSAEAIKQLCIQVGADDAGVVSIDRSELDDQRDDILRVAPWTRSLVTFVCKMNREPIRSPARSIANLEFHHTGDEVDEVSRELVRQLETSGVRAMNPSMGFPMEMDQFPGKIWVVSHKPVAVAAGLGKMGIHRNVIHPQFGNFILLGTVMTDLEISDETQSQPIDYNPCLECKLCVAACPVGAIAADGEFDFSACYTHNYREFMGGFSDWVENVADSKSREDYRERFSDDESASTWQSLSFGANYKAAYCLSVCPAGEDVIQPWLENRKGFMDETLRPLTSKEENVYVVPGSDAEEYVAKRFPHKTPRPVRGSLHPQSVASFLRYMSLQFQRGQAKGLTAVYHFRFFGNESCEATVTIRDQTLVVEEGLHGKPQLRVTADGESWIRFLRRERNLAWLLLTRKIRLKGSPLWLVRFGKCFPS